MSEKPKEDSMNPYDKIREEMRQKQQAKLEQQQRVAEMLNRTQNDRILDQMRGKNNE